MLKARQACIFASSLKNVGVWDAEVSSRTPAPPNPWAHVFAVQFHGSLQIPDTRKGQFGAY